MGLSNQFEPSNVFDRSQFDLTKFDYMYFIFFNDQTGFSFYLSKCKQTFEFLPKFIFSIISDKR